MHTTTAVAGSCNSGKMDHSLLPNNFFNSSPLRLIETTCFYGSTPHSILQRHCRCQICVLLQWQVYSTSVWVEWKYWTRFHGSSVSSLSSHMLKLMTYYQLMAVHYELENQKGISVMSWFLTYSLCAQNLIGNKWAWKLWNVWTWHEQISDL